MKSRFTRWQEVYWYVPGLERFRRGYFESEQAGWHSELCAVLCQVEDGSRSFLVVPDLIHSVEEALVLFVLMATGVSYWEAKQCLLSMKP